MSKKNFFLVTTSDEATWRFDRPIVFLGEWCCKYDRKHVWENLDFKISLPYGLKGSEKEKDYEELLKLEKKLFPKFCELLNKYHNTSFSVRFWQIFIGHWFRLTITQLIFKTKALKQCLERYTISSTLSFSFDKYSITPNFFLDSIDHRLLLPWKENILYSKILNLLKNVNFEKKVCNKYLSWGWHDSSEVVPLHYLNYNLNKKYKKNSNPDGIIISAINTSNIPNRMDSISRDLTNTKKYYKNISQFINSLDVNIRESSKIKYIDLGRSPGLSEFLNQSINFSKSKKSVIEQSIDYKIVVETLNSTGFLENLYFNVPSILILDENYSPIRNNAIKFFELLKNYNIVFNNPIHAAKHINKSYKDINLWWENKNLQNARINFCKEFVNFPDKNYLSIKNVLN